MRAFLIVALLALSPCAPVPEPVTPPTPTPVPPPSPPGPGATPCERACARADELHCDSGGLDCVNACERDQGLGGAFDRHPDCQAQAANCDEIERCRGGQ